MHVIMHDETMHLHILWLSFLKQFHNYIHYLSEKHKQV